MNYRKKKLVSLWTSFSVGDSHKLWWIESCPMCDFCEIFAGKIKFFLWSFEKSRWVGDSTEKIFGWRRAKRRLRMNELITFEDQTILNEIEPLKGFVQTPKSSTCLQRLHLRWWLRSKISTAGCNWPPTIRQSLSTITPNNWKIDNFHITLMDTVKCSPTVAWQDLQLSTWHDMQSSQAVEFALMRLNNDELGN
jgi:hypothetical protein